MGAAVDRLVRKLDRSGAVGLARIFVPRHPGHTVTGGITDVESYYRQYGERERPRAMTTRAGQPRPGESGYLFSPRREVTPGSSRLLRGTTETRSERRERLRKKLVDYKPERPLEGGEDIRKVIPGTEVKEYLDLPFLGAMHEKMGIDVDTVSIDEYVKKRNALFSPANTTDEEVPFDGLVATQGVVNRDQARKFIGKEFDPPPYVVRYRGTDYIINGHHRVVAEALAGKTGTRARVLDLGNRLVAQLAQRVDVNAYLRREGGHVEAVKAYTRVIDFLKSGGNLPTLNLPTGPKTFSPEQLVRAQLVEASLEGETAKVGAPNLGMVTTVQHSVQVGSDAGGLPVLKWDPEREKLHKEILDHFWKKEFEGVPSEGKAVVSGGIGGAGKSTILKNHADIARGDYGTVNPDDIKEYMAEHGMVPEVEGLDPMEASALAHEESSYLAMVLAQRAYAEKKNLIWDITMSSPGSVQKRVDALRKYGYSEIKGVFVDIPVELSVKRAVDRWWQGHQERESNGIGGRYVSPRLIRQQAAEEGTTKNRHIFESFESRFDSWEMWNTEQFPPTKVASKGRT